MTIDGPSSGLPDQPEPESQDQASPPAPRRDGPSRSALGNIVSKVVSSWAVTCRVAVLLAMMTVLLLVIGIWSVDVVVGPDGVSATTGCRAA
jgi:hypothetical protein